MNKVKTYIKLGGLLGIIVVCWIIFAKSFSSFRYTAGDDDAHIQLANRWLEQADQNNWDKAKAFTGSADADQILKVYQSDRDSLGTIESRDLRQKSSFNSPQGQVAIIEYQVKVKGRKHKISEKVFVGKDASDKAKPLKVLAARYIVPIPRLWKDGDYFAGEDNPKAGNPVTMAYRWFGDYDRNNLNRCARLAMIRGNLNAGRYFFDPEKLGADPRFLKWLQRTRSAGGAVKRETVKRQLWKGIWGASQMEIVRVMVRARYKKKWRYETLWAVKDNYNPSPRWLLYAASFGKFRKNKK